MTKADQIRRLAAEGLSVSEIAVRVGIRYQHAYNVINRGRAVLTAVPLPTHSPPAPEFSGGVVATPIPRTTGKVVEAKPPLSVQTLLDAGFQRASSWRLDEVGVISLTEILPKNVGVYAFAKEGFAMYVGVATMGLAKRIYFYGRPGITQRTSLRINDIIRRELQASSQIDVFVAHPEDMSWNGLPVHGAAGLELGLIKAFSLPWNKRSAN